ncbi:MAG: hypothetical protein QGI13_13660 [Rhodospirillales bacterium]|jgi:hypothetical protein|nr:hypothetical protein [Rhodospirillales bacterium]
MAKKSFLNRLTRALRADEGPTAGDIDDEVESAVKAIGEAQIDTVNAEDVLGDGWGETGAMVYILDLVPLYKMIGSRTGRLVSALRATCESVFSHHAGAGRGRAVFRGDQYFMRFADTDETRTFRLAATIINEVGARIFGDRFQPMAIPGLLVVADVGDITNQDGSLNAEMAAAVVHGGGLVVDMDEPDSDAPAWLSLRWNSVFGGGAASADPGGDGESGSGDTIYSKEPDPEPIHEWREQKQKKRGNDQWNDRGSERREKKDRSYRGGERRKSWRGRRYADNTRQVGW